MSERATDPHEAVDYIIKMAPQFAVAKAKRIYTEEFRKSKKALLMAQCDAPAANAREQYAYAHPEYVELLRGLQEAVEIEEALKWRLIAAQARVEVWRTEQATARAEGRATQ